MASDWKFTHMSVAGPRHLAIGAACEDASRAFWHERGGSVVLIAADGAGSAQHAAEAAVHVVESASRLISEGLCDDPAATTDPEALQGCLRAAAEHARTDIVRLASDRDGVVSPDDFATTLLIAMCNDSLLGALQVGDGHIVTMSRDSVLEVVFRPSKGRYVNETCFLTTFDSFAELDARGEVQTMAVEAGDMFGVALVSDGLEPVLARGHLDHHPGFFLRVMRHLWQDEITVFEQNILDFLSNSATLREVSDDDKTLAIAVRTNFPNLRDDPSPIPPGNQPAPNVATSIGGEVPKIISLDGSS